MTKEEYLKELEILNNIIKKANESIMLLRDKYIEANKEFEIGEKVKIITPTKRDWDDKIIPQKERFGIVYGYKLSYQNNINYLICKPKTDGGMSKINDTVWDREIIEKIK